MENVTPGPDFPESTTTPSFLPERVQGKRPTVMIAAFEGWNDAGEAASDAVKAMARMWGAAKLEEIEPDDYYDFQFTRPLIQTAGTGERVIRWPGTRIYKTTVDESGPEPIDVLLVHGVEPSYRWRSFTAELISRAEELGAERLVLLGSLLADVPHSRPLPVTMSSDDTFTQQTLGAEASSYQGPVGIVGVLAEVARLAGIPSVSLWAAVPHYVGQAPSPKAGLALLHRLEDILALTLDPSALVEDAEAWERGVDELAAEDQEIAAYVQQLEEATDTAELPEASGESIAREFERYLKRRDKGQPPTAAG